MKLQGHLQLQMCIKTMSSKCPVADNVAAAEAVNDMICFSANYAIIERLSNKL